MPLSHPAVWCKPPTHYRFHTAAASVITCHSRLVSRVKSGHKADRAESGQRKGCMASNRFTLLTEEDSAESVDNDKNAGVADKFDTTTLSAALTGARQAPVPMTAT